jgi:hypothetical protein
MRYTTPNMVKRTDLTNFRPENKPRISLFINQVVINRAKAKGALDGDTLSEVAEKALIEYTTDKRIKESLTASEVSPDSVVAGTTKLG